MFLVAGSISRVFLAAGSNFSARSKFSYVFGRGVKLLVYVWLRGRISLVFFAEGSHFLFMFGRGVKFLVHFWPRGHISCVCLAAGSNFSCVSGRGAKFSRVLLAAESN